MFRRLLETIKELILLFILISVGSALIDYGRITGGEMPLFCLKNYDAKTKIESFRGIFYQASRKVHITPEENLYESSDIQFFVLTKKIKVPSKFINQEFKYTLSTEESSNCGGTDLYYENDNTKLYTYCLDSIKLLEAGSDSDIDLHTYLEKDPSLVEDIVSNVPFRGMYNDDVLLFRTLNNNFVNNGMTIYRCHKKDNNDIYIGPLDMPMNDFCS